MTAQPGNHTGYIFLQFIATIPYNSPSKQNWLSVMPYYKHTSLRFKCTGCGRCCYGNKSDYILLSVNEAENIRLALNLDEHVFVRDYLSKLVRGGNGLRILNNGRCCLLDDNNQCRVYALRPTQCRTYPFWPEIINSSSEWHNEAKRCEGINRGEVVSLEHIEAELNASIEAES